MLDLFQRVNDAFREHLRDKKEKVKSLRKLYAKYSSLASKIQFDASARVTNHTLDSSTLVSVPPEWQKFSEYYLIIQTTEEDKYAFFYCHEIAKLVKQVLSTEYKVRRAEQVLGQSHETAKWFASNHHTACHRLLSARNNLTTHLNTAHYLLRHKSEATTRSKHRHADPPWETLAAQKLFEKLNPKLSAQSSLEKLTEEAKKHQKQLLETSPYLDDIIFGAM